MFGRAPPAGRPPKAGSQVTYTILKKLNLKLLTPTHLPVT